MSTLAETEIRDEIPAGRPSAGDAAALPKRSLGKTARQGTLALIDQSTVSGTRFLTMIIVGGRLDGRFGFGGSPEELGVYSLAFSLVLIIGCVLESLIAMPYTIYGNRLQGRARAEYAGSSLVYALILAVVVMLGLAGGAVLSAVGIGPPGLAPVFGILAVATPAILLWEFARFASFAHLHMAKAMALDLAVAGIQVGGLIGLGFSHSVTAVSAYAVIALACGLSSIVWLCLSRRGFAIRREQFRPSLRRNWKFGRWLCAGQAVTALNNQVLLWLLAGLCGIKAAGIFAACMFVLLLCNPFLLGTNNLLIPKVARAFVRGGNSEVRRVVRKSTLLLGAAMSLFCVPLMAFGDPVMQFFYGNRYAGQWVTLALLAVAAVTTACMLSINNGLWAIERPDLGFRASVLALIVAAVTAAICIPLWGVAGAACGLLAGSATSAVARYVAFMLSVAAPPVQGETA